jgi:hypothetical protein
MMAGAAVILLPHLGVPGEMRDTLLMILGSCIMVLGYAIVRAKVLRSQLRKDNERVADTYVETTESMFDNR